MRLARDSDVEGVEENERAEEGTGVGRDGGIADDEDEDGAKARGAISRWFEQSVQRQSASVKGLHTSSYVYCSP